ncbi:MAG TPA: hypothetical protein VGP68_16380 [Gemmataceae bacterium]|jgi:hypothetical protein|nr:hypothetical protein [Gemmataceae bacterium]
MGVLSWVKKESAAEKLIAKALVEFAQGDSKDALGNLVQGVVDIANGTKAEAPLAVIQAKLAANGLIPTPAPASLPIKAATTPVATPAPK